METENLVSRYIDEVFNGRDYDVYDELTTAEYLQHMGGETRTREEAKAFYAAVHEAFPDVEATLERMISDGEYVCSLHRYRGTHDGPFMGLEPTGSTVDIRSLTLSRIEDGKLAESWVVADMLGLMQQVGAVPAAE